MSPYQYFLVLVFKMIFISLNANLGTIFKASVLWADAFYKSKCLSVCLSVCLFTFEVPFKRLFAPTSQSQMSNILRDSESLGKKWKAVVSNLNIFVCKWSKIAAQIKVWFFLADFAVQNMLKTTLRDGWETSGRRVYR